MKGELWTMAMHQPVDTRELDRLAREIVRKARYFTHNWESSSAPAATFRTDLIQAVTDYEGKVFEMILGEPEVEV